MQTGAGSDGSATSGGAGGDLSSGNFADGGGGGGGGLMGGGGGGTEAVLTGCRRRRRLQPRSDRRHGGGRCAAPATDSSTISFTPAPASVTAANPATPAQAVTVQPTVQPASDATTRPLLSTAPAATTENRRGPPVRLSVMFEHLADLETELEKLESQLPEIYASGDQAAARDAGRRHAELKPVVDAYREYRRTEADVADARELLDGEDDAEMREYLQGEIAEQGGRASPSSRRRSRSCSSHATPTTART